MNNSKLAQHHHRDSSAHPEFNAPDPESDQFLGIHGILTNYPGAAICPRQHFQNQS